MKRESSWLAVQSVHMHSLLICCRSCTCVSAQATFLLRAATARPLSFSSFLVVRNCAAIKDLLRGDYVTSIILMRLLAVQLYFHSAASFPVFLFLNLTLFFNVSCACESLPARPSADPLFLDITSPFLLFPHYHQPSHLLNPSPPAITFQC